MSVRLGGEGENKLYVGKLIHYYGPVKQGRKYLV